MSKSFRDPKWPPALSDSPAAPTSFGWALGATTLMAWRTEERPHEILPTLGAHVDPMKLFQSASKSIMQAKNTCLLENIIGQVMVQNGGICQAFDLLAELHRDKRWRCFRAPQSPLAPSLAVRVLTVFLAELMGTPGRWDPVPILLPFQKSYSEWEECGNRSGMAMAQR